MNQSDNDFLRELQEACLKEVDDYLNDFREVLCVFKDDITKGVEQIQKVIHSMKGNLQAVGFLHFGNYVHELESILDRKTKEATAPEGKALPDFEVLVFEYLLSSILEGMGSYVNELKALYLDSEELAAARREQLSGLEKWEPKFDAGDIPLFTPAENLVYVQPDIDSLLSAPNVIALVPKSNENKKIIELEMPDTGGFEMKDQNIDIAELAAEASSAPAEPEVAVAEGPSPMELAMLEHEIPELSVEMPAEVSLPTPVEDVAPVATPVALETTSIEPSASAGNGQGGSSNGSHGNPQSKPPQEWLNYRGSGLFLLFQNHKKYFAIAIEHIVEVIKSQPLSTPPHKRKNLRGLLNLRGEVLPILNVDAITTEGDPKPTYVVVSQVDDLRFGFQVESVHQVVTLDPKVFQSVDGLSEDNGTGIVTHFCQTEDKTISILKLNELVAA